MRGEERSASPSGIWTLSRLAILIPSLLGSPISTDSFGYSNGGFDVSNTSSSTLPWGANDYGGREAAVNTALAEIQIARRLAESIAQSGDDGAVCFRHYQFSLDAILTILGSGAIDATQITVLTSRLVAARQELAGEVSTVAQWLVVARSVEPGRRHYRVPDRFIRRQPPDPVEPIVWGESERRVWRATERVLSDTDADTATT